MRPAVYGFIGMAVIFTLGCRRSGVERVILTGKVTYDGQPVDVGKIFFVPDEGSTAPLTVTDFKDGQYDTSLSEGVAVGAYRVEITGHRAADLVNYRPGPFSKPANQIVPAKYNSKTELKLEVASGEARKVHDFELPK